VLPTGVVAIAFLIAMIPGWLYLRWRDRIRPPSNLHGVSEILAVASVGVGTTGSSAALIALLPLDRLPFLIDVDEWARSGNDYWRGHVRDGMATGMVVLILAIGLAYLLFLVQRIRRPEEFLAHSNVWVQSLGARGRRGIPWVGIKLNDGRLVEGLLHSYSISSEDDTTRDIALAGPIRVTDSPGEQPRPLAIDRLIVPESGFQYLCVIHVPERAASP